MAGQRNYAKNLAALAILESQKLPLRPLFKTVQFQENLMGGVKLFWSTERENIAFLEDFQVEISMVERGKKEVQRTPFVGQNIVLFTPGGIGIHMRTAHQVQ